MARTGIPDPLERRHLVEKDLPAAQALAIANAYLEKDRCLEALDFLRILWAIDHGLGSVSKRMLSRLGVTAPQRLVLRMVGRFPGVTASEMAALLHLDRSTMSGIVTRLVERGLLVRQADAADRRRVRLEVTARGRRLVGWDEILEGGLAENATVMSWRGTAGGIAAAKAVHDVIMAPNSHLYFDHYQARPQNE